MANPEPLLGWNTLVQKNRRIIWNPSKSRWESQALIGADWFVIDASPSRKIEYEFSGVFDRTAIFNLIVTDRGTMRSVMTGAGTLASLDVLGAAMRITTGAIAGDDFTVGCGDNTGFIHPWNVTRDIYYQLRFRVPLAADLAHVFQLLGLYYDADNYICMRYDPDGTYYAADPHRLLVTRSGGLETTTQLSTPDNNWHTLNVRARTDSVLYVWDTAITVIHTTHVPTVNLGHYFFIETEEGLAKSLDLEHLFVLQDNLEF